MKSEELQAEWQRIIDQVMKYDGIDQSQVNAFFSRLVPQAMSDGFLMLTADNDFIKSWIENHYLELIQKALTDLTGKQYSIAIEVDPNQESRPDTAPSTTATAASAGDTSSPESPANPLSTREGAPAPEQPANPPETESDYDDPFSPTSSLTFNNFVLGTSNRMAYSMAVAVAEEPGRQMLNPLFIYGKSGLGKTHLMRAIQNYIAETRPEMKTIYTDSDDFTNAYVEAALEHDKEKTSFKNFKSRYQDADVLLIDDIQNLQGREQTLDIVFQIFNHMTDEGKQIVLSADRAPKNITMDERYQSRFNMGATFDIQPPSVETKFGIITLFVEEYRTTSNQPDFELPEEIAHYIAENSGSNIRELKSAVTKIIYAINAFGTAELTVDKVKSLLENHFSGGAMKKLSISDIQKQVEQYFDVSHSDLVGAKRDRRIMYARKVAVYLSREMLDLPFKSIGDAFGGRDHTTIMHSVASVEKQLNESREAREEIDNIKRRIKEM